MHAVTESSRRLLRNLNWVFSANAIAGVANLLAIAWFARTLGPVTMGEYASVVTAVQLVVAFLSAGFDQAVIRMPGDPEVAGAAAMATVLQSLLLVLGSAVVYLVFFFQSPVEARGLAGPAAVILTAIIVSIFSYLIAAPIAAELDYRFLALSRLVATAAGIGSGVAMAMQGHELYSLALRDALTAVVMLALCWWRAGAGLRWRTTRDGFRRLFVFAKGLWALNLTERLVHRLDHGIVGLLLGKEVLGAYFVVRGLVEGILGFLVNPIQTVLFTHYCRLEQGGAASRMPGHRLIVGYVLACAGAALLAWAIGTDLLTRLLGGAYSGMGVILPSLVIYAGAILWFENEKVRAMARLRHQGVVLARMVQIVLYLLSIFPAIHFFGVGGAGAATAAAGVALALAATWIAWRKGRHVPDR